MEHLDLSKAFSDGLVTINPQLYSGNAVIVPEWNAYISVYGMVNKVGKIPVGEADPITVLDAMSQAGPDPKRAKLSDVLIARKEGKDTEGKDIVKQFHVNINDIMHNKKTNQNSLLKPGDVVYVPDNGTRVVDILPWLLSARL